MATVYVMWFSIKRGVRWRFRQLYLLGYSLPKSIDTHANSSKQNSPSRGSKRRSFKKGKTCGIFRKIYIAVKSARGPLNVFIMLCPSGFSRRKARSLDVAVAASWMDKCMEIPTGIIWSAPLWFTGVACFCTTQVHNAEICLWTWSGLEVHWREVTVCGPW